MRVCQRQRVPWHGLCCFRDSRPIWIKRLDWADITHDRGLWEDLRPKAVWTASTREPHYPEALVPCSQHLLPHSKRWHNLQVLAHCPPPPPFLQQTAKSFFNLLLLFFFLRTRHKFVLVLLRCPFLPFVLNCKAAAAFLITASCLLPEILCGFFLATWQLQEKKQWSSHNWHISSSQITLLAYLIHTLFITGPPSASWCLTAYMWAHMVIKGKKEFCKALNVKYSAKRLRIYSPSNAFITAPPVILSDMCFKVTVPKFHCLSHMNGNNTVWTLNWQYHCQLFKYSRLVGVPRNQRLRWKGYPSYFTDQNGLGT